MNIVFSLNGEEVSVDTDPKKLLVYLLREDFNLKGTRHGCTGATCGDCTVLIDGKLQLSCIVPAFTVKGTEVLTIEGFSRTDAFRDINEGFKRANYLPCGYCAPGKILAVHALLELNPQPTEQEIYSALAGNRCRCDDRTTLLQGIQSAAFLREARRHDRKA
jgi:carbon-monoxide dehydrogenase small subunit